MQEIDKTIVFILSSNYSGSTMLSLMLGANSSALQVGEVKRLRRSDQPFPPCPLCGEDVRCRLFEGVTRDNIIDIHENVFANAPEANVIIDCSKKVFWAKRFVENKPGYRYKAIHLLRDPRALVRRWDLMYKTRKKIVQQYINVSKRDSGSIFKLPFQPKEMLYLRKWLNQNLEITSFLDEYAVDHRLVTYHDLVVNTEKELSSLSKWAGLKFEDKQLKYWEVPQHGGSKIADIGKVKSIELDLRWQSYLDRRIQQKIVQNPTLMEYLKKSNIDHAENGLMLSRE